ncbi:MAG: ABC transporter permease [Muribaculaceae bacterium]|nr:ABC transporter permease [Muribaculaceae bacterium]
MSLFSLPTRIACRYLRAPKSHSAVSAIAIISVVGVAIATAAIVCVLSVFNGFRSLLVDRLDTLAPDVMITPSSGKTFADADSLAEAVGSIKGVEIAMPSVTDNALAIFNSREMPVTLRGIDPALYSRITSLDSLIRQRDEAAAPVAALSPSEVVLSIGTAAQLGIGETDQPLLIFAPRREGRVNLTNPIASFITDSVYSKGIFQSFRNEYDENYIICDISTARNLFQYDTEGTAIEVKTLPGADPSEVARSIEKRFGNSVIVKDRLQQQEINFRMISIEKWVTFLLLIFILIIASFNIISTLCMLVLDKQNSLATLSALGMSRGKIAAVFRRESLIVSLTGGVAGLILGVGLSLLQQHFGLIRLAGDPSNMVVTAYPVVVVPSDVVVAFIPVAVIGVLTALIAGAFARGRIK